MQNLEAQLHILLEDIAPNAHTIDEQAKIIAIASSVLNKRFNSRRLAKSDPRVVESQMTDAILVAMSALESENYDDDNYYQDYGNIKFNYDNSTDIDYYYYADMSDEKKEDKD